ncbi:MAG: hypothetical protein ABIS50_09225 [Luteolibacter sp.]|uniref:hypothetical protein n=1 Tax=Luteolibacter sp. TaxID=1962973 RepID=UPI00326776B6
MKRIPFTKIIAAAAVGGALMIFGIVLWISVPESDASSDAGRSVSAPMETAAAPLPLAEPGEPDRSTEFSAEDDIGTRMASLARLASSDPAAAALSLDGMPAGEERTTAMRTVFRQWAATSPRDALAWISTMNAEPDRNKAREFLCHRVAEDDPKLALDFAREAGADTATSLVQDLAQQWAGSDAAAARDWALALPADADRDQILARVCQVLSQSDPLTAGAIVSGEIAAGSVQDEAAMSVLHQWAIRDPAAAREWVARFPDGPLRIRAEGELAGIRDYQANTNETP